MKYARRCKHCGAPFETNDASKVHCQKACTHAAAHARRRANTAAKWGKLRCEACDGPIKQRMGRYPRFCSDRCKQRFYRAQRKREKCNTCGEQIEGTPVTVGGTHGNTHLFFCSWRCRLARYEDDPHNFSGIDAAHLAVLDLQQAARHIPVLPPLELDEEQDHDERLPVAAAESAPDGSPFEDEYGKPIRHMPTDWNRRERARYDEEHDPY